MIASNLDNVYKRNANKMGIILSLDTISGIRQSGKVFQEMLAHKLDDDRHGAHINEKMKRNFSEKVSKLVAVQPKLVCPYRFLLLLLNCHSSPFAVELNWSARSSLAIPAKNLKMSISLNNCWARRTISNIVAFKERKRRRRPNRFWLMLR